MAGKPPRIPAAWVFDVLGFLRTAVVLLALAAAAGTVSYLFCAMAAWSWWWPTWRTEEATFSRLVWAFFTFAFPAVYFMKK